MRAQLIHSVHCEARLFIQHLTVGKKVIIFNELRLFNPFRAPADGYGKINNENEHHQTRPRPRHIRSLIKERRRNVVRDWCHLTTGVWNWNNLSAINFPEALEATARRENAFSDSFHSFRVVKKRFVHNVAIKSMFSFHYLELFVDLFSVLAFLSTSSSASAPARCNELLFAIDFINGKNFARNIKHSAPLL